MKYSDIPAAAKMTTASIMVIMGIISWSTTFQTDAEAAEMEQRVSKTLNDVRTDNIDAQISAYEFQLLDNTLSAEKREWLERQIKKLEAKKQCIQRGEC